MSQQMPGQTQKPKGFFAAFFDFDFNNFITLKFVKFIYIVGMVLIGISGALGLVFGLITAFGIGSDFGGFAGFIAFIFSIPLVLLVTAAYLLFLRLGLEALVVFFRVGQNTSTIVNILDPDRAVPWFGDTSSEPGAPSGPGGGWPGPSAPPPAPSPMGSPYGAPPPAEPGPGDTSPGDVPPGDVPPGDVPPGDVPPGDPAAPPPPPESDDESGTDNGDDENHR